MKVLLYWRAGFILQGNPFVKSGNLKFGTMKFYLKGGCHYG